MFTLSQAFSFYDKFQFVELRGTQFKKRKSSTRCKECISIDSPRIIGSLPSVPDNQPHCNSKALPPRHILRLGDLGVEEAK